MYIFHLTAGVIRYGMSAITDGCPHDEDIDDDNADRCLCVTVVCGVFFCKCVGVYI